MLDRVIAHQVTQRVGIPAVAIQQRLLAPRAGVACRFRAHPAGLAPLLAEQPVQKQPGVPRRAVTGKQWPDPPLYVLQGRRPDFQRRLDRCTCHTMTSESW
jgi:hypothetical protein